MGGIGWDGISDMILDIGRSGMCCGLRWENRGVVQGLDRGCLLAYAVRCVLLMNVVQEYNVLRPDSLSMP